jgi:hypothetical protein
VSGEGEKSTKVSGSADTTIGNKKSRSNCWGKWKNNCRW